MKFLIAILLLIAGLSSLFVASGQVNDDDEYLKLKKRPFVSSGSATFSFTNGTPTLPPGGGASAWDCNTTCAPFSLGFTVPSGDALIICVALGTNAFITSADTSYGTWVTANTQAGLKAFQSTATQAISCAYVITTSSVSTVTMGYNVDAAGTPAIYDLHKSSGTITAETIPTSTTSTSCSTTCASPTVTITGSNDAILSAAAFGNVGCSVNSPFTNFQSINGDSVAQNLNTVTGTGAVWKQGTSCPTAAAAQFAGLQFAFK